MVPKPRHVVTVCDVCELPWEDHGSNPTLETCVRLLAAEVKKRQAPSFIPPARGWWCYRCSMWVYGSHMCNVVPWTYTYTTGTTAQPINRSGSVQSASVIDQLKCQLSSSVSN